MSTILKTYFTDDLIRKIITTILGLIVFTVIYLIINRILKRVTKQKLKPQTATILQKVFKYLYYTMAVIYILGIFDIKVTALFGAAGIAGVAIGFAAQTSFSNIISGFFVLTEHSLKIGDYITVDDVSGTVDSIDMLSIKLKTPDHQMVRIPNETILKANLHNTSYFPTRRLNVTVSVSYNTDLQFALDTLATVPAKCPLVLTDPAPIIFYDSFGDSGINLILGVWLNNSDLIAVKNQVFIAIKKTFDDAGIEIPFPQIDVHTKD